MTTRILPPEEWPRLATTDLAAILTQIPADAATVFVVEDGAGIIGCWALITFAHVEGLWVAPTHRKRGRVLVRLWSQLVALAKARSLGAVFTGALTDDVRRLLEARGASPLPPMYVLPVQPLRN